MQFKVSECLSIIKGLALLSQYAYHPWLTEIPAPDGGPGNYITNEGLKLQVLGPTVAAGEAVTQRTN